MVLFEPFQNMDGTKYQPSQTQIPFTQYQKHQYFANKYHDKPFSKNSMVILNEDI